MTRNNVLILLILGLFTACLLVIYPSSGSDLTASYASCQLMRSGQTSHLYAFDTASFSDVSDPVWLALASRDRIPAQTHLTPFVQTPLWPFVLQPLCASASFRTFNLIFKAILALSFSGLIWFAGRAWTTRFFHPGWILLLAIGCLRFDPLRDAMTMTQTHGIFLLATVFAILLARNGHPLWAGLLLSLAASVKITPAAMVFYWMVTSHWRATLSFLASMAAWTAITFAAVGRATMDAYLHSISRVSNVLLLSGNNQSFAAWWMARFYPASEAQVYHSYPLPLQLKLLCGALVLGSALLGGLCDRRLRVAEPGAPPYGAVIALLGATIFTPIAWSHYSIVLVLPIMLLLDRALRWRSAALMVGAGIVFLLADCNLLSRQLTHWRLPTGWLLRGQFLACGLAMAALLLLVGRLLWKNPEQSGQRAQMPSAA